MKILFMGTPDFAEESLQKLVNSKHEILGVVTKPDKPSGRGMKMISSPVKDLAVLENLKIYQPEKIKNNIEFIEEIRNLKPDIICVVAYGKILPKEILDIPKLGCINLHGSILPKYRGAAPIQWAVLNGDNSTGVTTMYMSEEMDAGDIIYEEETPIGEYETTGEVWDRLKIIGADLLLKTIDDIEKGIAPRNKQNGEISFAPMLNKEMAKINWNEESIKIKNLVYGLNPIIGAYTMYNDKKIKIWKIKILDEKSDKPEGYIIEANDKTGLKIQTKDKIILVTEIQGENSRKMPINDYLRGNKIEVGTILK